MPGDDVSLKEFFNHRFEELDKFYGAKFEAGEKALEIADIRLQEHLRQLNNAKAELERERANFITKNDYDTRHETICEKIRILELSRAEWSGKASQSSVYISYLLFLINIAVSVWMAVHR